MTILDNRSPLPVELGVAGHSCAVVAQNGALPSPVVCLGYQDRSGHIVVTHVLAMNFPTLTKEQIADLSWKLDEFGRRYRETL